jgi:hypothetical protein
MSGSGWMGRAPGFNRRMKQSCRLRNSRCSASSRSRSGAQRRHSAMEALRSHSISRRLNQPIHRVSKRLGILFVTRKFRSSWRNGRTHQAGRGACSGVCGLRVGESTSAIAARRGPRWWPSTRRRIRSLPADCVQLGSSFDRDCQLRTGTKRTARTFISALRSMRAARSSSSRLEAPSPISIVPASSVR